MRPGKRGVFTGCDTALFKKLAFIAQRKFSRGDCESLSADFTGFLSCLPHSHHDCIEDPLLAKFEGGGCRSRAGT